MHPPDRRLAGTHQRTGSRLMPTMTTTMPKFSRDRRASGPRSPPRCRSRASGTILLRLRAAAVKYIEFILPLARQCSPVWRDRASATHCTLYTDKLDHLSDIGQHGAHPFLTTPQRDHVRHAIHRSESGTLEAGTTASVVDHTQCTAMAMQLRWRLMPSRSAVSAPPSFS